MKIIDNTQPKPEEKLTFKDLDSGDPFFWEHGLRLVIKLGDRGYAYLDSGDYWSDEDIESDVVKRVNATIVIDNS